MSSRKTRQIAKALTDKGFEPMSTHHEMYWFSVDGKKTSIRTRISHGFKEYGDQLLAQMAKQVKLKRDQLELLIDCPLSKEGYVEILVEQGILKLFPKSVPEVDGTSEQSGA